MKNKKEVKLKALIALSLSLLLLQERRLPRRQDDSVPVPQRGPADPGGAQCLHAEPHFGEAAVLVDGLRSEGH